MHQTLLADIGVPMIFVQWPLMFCALVFVIAIEAEVARRRLALPARRAFAGAAKANVLSTLVGVPLAWLFMLAVAFTTALPLAVAGDKWHWPADPPLEYILAVLGMAWTADSGRAVALAATLLLVPTFFMSVFLERRWYRRSWPDLDVAAVDRCAWLANLFSYSFLLVAACTWFGWELHMGHR